MMNHLPVKGGFSDTISLTAIMRYESLHYKTNIGLHIGQYCLLHKEVTPINSNKPHAKGARCMVPSGNIHGGFKFMIMRSI